MKNTINALFQLSFILIFFSCDLFSPNEGDTEIDTKILGDWYYTANNAEWLGPNEYIYGIQIDNNGQIFRLAIETSSGRLSILDSNAIGIVEKTHNKKITYKIYSIGMMLEGTYQSSYKVKGDSLLFYLSNDEERRFFLNNFYLRSELGDQLAEPLQSHFQIIEDGHVFENDPINGAVSAYAYSSNIDSSFVIIAIGSNETYQIKISGFLGVGDYNLDKVEIFHMTSSGDEIYAIGTFEDSSTVDLQIQEYQGFNRISGELDFIIGWIEFTDGVFSVPVFN